LKLSQSGIKKFLECPGKCWLRYGENLNEESGYFAVVGQLVHSMIQDRTNGVVGNPLPVMEGSAYVEAFDLFQAWEKRFYPDLDPKDVLSVEEQVILKWGDNEIEVRFDDAREVGGFIVLTDWKTTHKLLTTEEMREDIQTRLYLLAALVLWPTYDEFIYRIGNIRFRDFQTIEISRQEILEWLEPTKNLINLVSVNIEARRKGDDGACQFTPGAPCTYCGYFNVCPAAKKILTIPKKGFEVKPIIKADVAVTVGEKLAIVARYKDDLTKALKAWCEEKGGVKVSNGTWAIRSNPKSWIDIERVPEEMLPDLKPYMVLNDGKKSAIWENKTLIEKLQALGAVKVILGNEFKCKAEDFEP
jgi:hypothetical protein